MNKELTETLYPPFKFYANSFINYTTCTPPKNYYTFNGMEFQQDNNLNTFNFHARMYDPQIGRTFQPDPLADQFLDLSPYSFLNNNPINYMDPTGMKSIEKYYESLGGGGGWNSMGGGFNGVTYGGANLAPNPLGSTYNISMGLGETTSNTQQYWYHVYCIYENGKLIDVENVLELKPDDFAQGGGGNNLALGSLLAHYTGGSGDNYYINQRSFNGLISELAQKKALNFKNGVPAPGVPGLYKLEVSTYGTSYANAAGYATLYYNSTGIVRYSDFWNFESHGGDRDLWSETKTTIGSAIPGTPFWVLYGKTSPTNLIVIP